MQLEQELRDFQDALEQIQAHVSRAQGLGGAFTSQRRTLPATAGVDGREVARQVEAALQCRRGAIADLEGERDHLIDLLFKAQVR